MYEIQWFKLDVNIFDNRKIQMILKEPDGDTGFVMWIKLISIAVQCNCQGNIMLTQEIPMTIETFARIMGKSKRKVEKLINKFIELEMLIFENGILRIKNWDKYQSIEKLEKIRIQNRERQIRYREKIKSEKEKSNVKNSLGNAKENKKIEIEENIEENIKRNVNEVENGFKQYKL